MTYFFMKRLRVHSKNETRIRVSNKKKKEDSLISIFNNKNNLSLKSEGLIKKI